VLSLDASQWVLAALAAFLFGISKTGISGLGILGVAIFANVLPPRESAGYVLPLLIAADLVAVKTYRRHAQWPHLFRLCPWAVVGVVIGYFAVKIADPKIIGRLIGAILVALTLLQMWRSQRARLSGQELAVPHRFWFALIMGILAGFTTMVANAAGPIMVIYLLAMGLPKYEFLGTGAWYFFLLNTFKVPFSCNLGLINKASLLMDAVLAPATIIGALAGVRIVRHIDQRLFEMLALVLSLLAGLKLLVF
jgi:uncharacterized protein